MKLDSKTASFYHSRPSKWLGGRSAVVPAAHVLGGGSSINFMVMFRLLLQKPGADPCFEMYTRASASDYDDFKTPGWTTNELLPLMKKHETYQRACNNRDIHGFEVCPEYDTMNFILTVRVGPYQGFFWQLHISYRLGLSEGC